MSKGCYVVVNGTTKKVKKKYVVVDGVTKKVKKKYVVVDGVTKLVYSAEVFGSYSGTYTVSQVTDTEGTLCDLYTITGSGTLELGDSARYWICGGGACGDSSGGNGGGGGRVNSGTIDAGSHIIAIGAGGTRSARNGANTTIAASGNVTEATANGGGSNGNGGSGGGSGGMQSPDIYNSGAGVSTYPFGITSLYAHSAGGAGGNCYHAYDTYYYRKGGTGGSNGSNGGRSSYSIQLGYAVAGGQHGGGSGGTAGREGEDATSSITATTSSGGSATFYGSGGGGGGYFRSDFNNIGSSGGNGYQGVMYLLIPR